MDLPFEVEQIEEEIRDVQKHLHAFGTRSQGYINKDRKEMLIQLQKSVECINNTVEYFETGSTSAFPRLLTCNTIDPSPGLTHETIISEHLRDMDTRFADLHDAASWGLERAEFIKKISNDTDGDLYIICAKLGSSSTRIQSALRAAQTQHWEKETELSRAITRLDSVQHELEILETRLKKYEEMRDDMRRVGNGTVPIRSSRG